MAYFAHMVCPIALATQKQNPSVIYLLVNKSVADYYYLLRKNFLGHRRFWVGESMGCPPFTDNISKIFFSNANVLCALALIHSPPIVIILTPFQIRWDEMFLVGG